MVYKKIQNDNGDYKDAQGVRWDVMEANEAWTPQGMNVGWDEFGNMDEALRAYDLILDPLPSTREEEEYA